MINAIKEYVVVTQNRLKFTYHGFYHSISNKKALFWRVIFENYNEKKHKKNFEVEKVS